MSDSGITMSAALAGLLAVGGIGAGAAWIVDRRTRLSASNWYLASGLLAALLGLALAAGISAGFGLGLGAILWALLTASAVAGKSRRSHLSGGGELRDYELGRPMAWTLWR